MRLLKVEENGEFSLTDHIGKTTERYAILSHTWGDDNDEVSFKDFSEGTAKDKIGYKKIQSCGRKAVENGLKYIWVDTCCIDKSSSAELSEAINSMFNWYKDSVVCFVFLSDLEPGHPSLQGCRWLQRGWTLQELIAPADVRFFDKEWNLRGDKINLSSQLALLTQVSVQVLTGFVSLEEVPVAVRMSWAATRNTTREEDRAYSLLGIFQVNMPMVYGEGNKAFIRLQEEIMKDCADMSIFAWTQGRTPGLDCEYSGLLATSPADFRDSASLEVAQDTIFDIRDFSMTNRGLRFQVPLTIEPSTGCHILPINHGSSTSSTEIQPLGVYLRQVGPDLFVRALPNVLAAVQHRGPVRSLQITKALSAKDSMYVREHVLTFFRPESLQHEAFGLSEIEPTGCWDPSRKMLFAGHTGVFLGYLRFEPAWADEFDSFVLICRFDRTINPPWRLQLVCGDDWRDDQPRYQDIYGYHHKAFQQHSLLVPSLTLQHLYDESRAKQVTVSLVLKGLSELGHYSVSIEVEDVKSIGG